MSPEQVQSKEIDHRSDLFSLGVVLYELIAQRNPFKRDSEAATLRAVSDDAPEPLARFKSGLPDGLQDIVDKALEKDTKTRYQHADGMLSDLMRVKRSLESGQTAATGAMPSARSARFPWVAMAIIVIAAAVTLVITKPWTSSTVSDKPEKIMLAVLPFENLGEREDEYFADGITDEIISRLAALHGLGVISRTSTLQYKQTTKNLREIGAELGVDYILEGTIRWDKSGEKGRVRINPQLIQVDDDVHLWTNRYDAVIDDIFTVQSSIAEEVVLALDIALVESERQALAAQPTDNADAYDYYLRGIENLYMTPDKVNFENAVAMFLDAIELDPKFAMAYIWLSFVHGQMYLYGHDNTEERVNLSKHAIDRALEISPNLPESHGALGWFYYQCHRDFDRAREEFSLQRDERPSDASAYMGIAVADRTQGRWESSAENWRRATELDPLFARVYFEYGFTLYWMRHYPEAEKAFDRALRLIQGWHTCSTIKSWIYVLRNGDIDGARRVLREALQENDRWPDLTYNEIRLDILSQDYDKALSLLSKPGDVIELATDSAHYYNLKGDIYRYMKQTDQMSACYDSARVILEKRLQSEPDNPEYHASLGWVYAGLGRKQDAISECNRAAELMPLSKNAITGAEILNSLASIYTIIGEYDLAIEQLEHLLSIPSEISVPYLKIWPEFTPLHDHPRFQALMEKYRKEHGT
jgi:serine/threonine-protein kinase